MIPESKTWIVFSCGDSWVSEAIIWFRRKANPSAWASHCAPVIEIGGKVYAVDADQTGINLNDFFSGKEAYTDPSLRVEVVEVSAIEELMFRERQEIILRPVSRRVYGYGQLIGMAWVSLMSWSGIRAENPIKSNEICSEVSSRHVARVAYNRSTSDAIKVFGFDRIAPDDLYSILTKEFSCPVVMIKAVGETELRRV